ncbi:transposase [Shewanella yunxiaonensis]|uniref:Transposase n=1 Tax=Shewanella yunxiaonensis TaxID=2829809 RepID=A0ABX7YVF3_9GAMM|nr:MULTISPECIES: transposase [Shewanella]MDF0533027.1 transposase [Shewanella sp. A32]QUN06320.1 transposase [Shewanella yunxiaonensis]
MEMTDTVRHQAVIEVTHHGRLLFDVARQYGLPTKTLYLWVRQSEQTSEAHASWMYGITSMMSQLKAKYFN